MPQQEDLKTQLTKETPDNAAKAYPARFIRVGDVVTVVADRTLGRGSVGEVLGSALFAAFQQHWPGLWADERQGQPAEDWAAHHDELCAVLLAAQELLKSVVRNNKAPGGTVSRRPRVSSNASQFEASTSKSELRGR